MSCDLLTDEEKASMVKSNPEYYEDMYNVYRDAHIVIATRIIMDAIKSCGFISQTKSKE